MQRTTSAPRLQAAALALMLAGLTACGAARGASPGTGGVPEPAMGLEAAIARAKADSARTPWVEADARFMNDMIGHHAQAVEMSRLAPTHGASQQVRVLAARIINAQ